MECKYSLNYKGIKRDFDSIEKLYEFLTDKELNKDVGVVDVIFSKDLQAAQAEALKNIKKVESNKSLDKHKRSLITGEDTIFEGDGAIAITSFFDNSGEAMLNGRRIVVPLDENQYRINELQDLTEDKKMSEKAARDLIETTISNWKTTGEIGRDLHKLIISKFVGGGTDADQNERKQNFINWAQDMLGDSPLNNVKLLGHLFESINTFYKKNKNANSTALRGINLTAKLRNSNTELFGHIDYAFIDDNGRLHIYNFKASSQDSNVWSQKKWEKYILEQSFIKQMLSHNNINISGIQMHIVPIKLNYTGKKLSGIFINDPIDYETSSRTSQYINDKYDYIARYFIDSGENIIKVTDEQDEHIDDICQAIFPSQQVRGENIRKSADEWIKKAPSSGEEAPLIIREVNADDYRYVVIIGGHAYKITESFKEKTRNPQIIKIVQDNIERLNMSNSDYVNKVTEAIRHTFDRNLENFDFSKLKVGVGYLEKALSPYVTGHWVELDDNKKVFDYDWRLIDSLASKNILLFENKRTHQIDVVTISSKDLYQIPKYDFGNNILGGYVTDRDFVWKGDFGNVETVRSMVILNEYLPQIIKEKDRQLGNIKIVSRLSMGRSYNIEHVYKDYLNPIFKVVRNNNKGLSITDNLKSQQYSDPLELLMKEIEYITSEGLVSRSVDQNLHTLMDQEEVSKLKSTEQKRAQLLVFLQRLEEAYPGYLAMDQIEKSLESHVSTTQNIAKLYKMAVEAFNYYSGYQVTYEHTLSSAYKNISTAPTVPDANINSVVNVLQVAIDQIADETNAEYDNNIRKLVTDFYKEVGYSNVQNMTLGNQTHLFDNLYQRDSEGNKLMLFKNPYINEGDTYYLSNPERKFLKKALFLFNKYNFKNRDKKGFTSENDPKIAEYIENSADGEQYLWVPLERASKSSRRQQGIKNYVNRTKRWMHLFFSSSGREELFDEAINNMTPEEREFMEDGLNSFRFRDPFQRDRTARENYIEQQGVDYFESNVENLLIDRLYQSVNSDKINEALTMSKAILLQLKLAGDNQYTKKIIDQEVKYIEDYLKINVFKKSIMEPGSQKIIGALSQVRQGVVFLNLAGNTIAAIRDVENGFFENYLRVASKYQTNISAKNLSKAYNYVVKEGSFDAMKVTLLSKLCVKYRLSNTDTARISERLRSNRQGLSNWDNIAYSTLRAPDFLNRMTLFIAQAMEDGVIDAWEVKDDELVYNWKKDKRFSIYAQGESMKNHPEYAKQKGLYRLKIREWNMDHPKNQLSYEDDLPTPYSNQEIIAIKNVANNIYGSYDKSLRAMGENLALGWAFGMYTTWMNGMWNNWTLKPGVYNINRMNIEQETDLEGNLLFEDDNQIQYVQHTLENGEVEYVNEDTGEKKSIEELTPILKKVPVIAQGVIATLTSALKILRSDKGGFIAAKDYILADQKTKETMEHAFFSLLLAGLFFFFFKLALDPAYKEVKKEYKEMAFGEKVFMESIFRPIKPAVDSLFGPINVIQYLGSGTEPPLYNVPLKLGSDLFKTTFGDKTIAQFITGNFAIARIFKNIF